MLIHARTPPSCTCGPASPRWRSPIGYELAVRVFQPVCSPKNPTKRQVTSTVPSTLRGAHVTRAPKVMSAVGRLASSSASAIWCMRTRTTRLEPAVRSVRGPDRRLGAFRHADVRSIQLADFGRDGVQRCRRQPVRLDLADERSPTVVTTIFPYSPSRCDSPTEPAASPRTLPPSAHRCPGRSCTRFLCGWRACSYA